MTGHSCGCDYHTAEYWHSGWPLQEADVRFLGIEILSQVKQCMRWVECIDPYISHK